MTNEDWKKAETALDNIYGSVKLNADGYELTIQPVKQGLKFLLAVYVNGCIKGEWVLNDCEIRRKFYCCSKRSVLTSKEKSEMIKEVGKRYFEVYSKEHPERLHYYTYQPYFSSFRTLKSQLIKNNKDIQLVKVV